MTEHQARVRAHGSSSEHLVAPVETVPAAVANVIEPGTVRYAARAVTRHDDGWLVVTTDDVVFVSERGHIASSTLLTAIVSVTVEDPPSRVARLFRGRRIVVMASDGHRCSFESEWTDEVAAEIEAATKEARAHA